jgi:hypothetical protein
VSPFLGEIERIGYGKVDASAFRIRNHSRAAACQMLRIEPSIPYGVDDRDSGRNWIVSDGVAVLEYASGKV